MDSSGELLILECTIRDGNYAIDFKFTEADTNLVTGQLAHLGFKWIEIGHGLGLGGMEAGKGNMPGRDIDMIRAAKMACGDAKIGAFFIPGIGRMEHLEMARDAGLAFVRVGNNATDAEKAYPYIKRARALGLIPCLNMMKSYTVTPATFAMKAQGAVDAGAEVVYCVDSAGCMLPDDLARYYDATRDVVDCRLGFHGHNNLMMAVANCITAYKHGARYLDTSLCGLGRSAGNASTEILVAVLERLGIPTGIDLFKLMDMIEMYMWPLVAQIRPHDMMGVTAGYSQFHSSFLPKVAAAARKHHVELRRLVAEVALHDPVNVEDNFLEAAARGLANTDTPCSSEALLSFHAPGISSQRISNSMRSLQALIDGLVASSAKCAGTRAVLQLVPSEELIEGLLLPEFVLGDDQMVMGRVTFGSFDVLRQVVDLAHRDIFMFLVNQEENWAAQALQVVAQVVDSERAVSVHDEELRKLFLIEALGRAAQHFGQDALLVYNPTPLVLQALTIVTSFSKVFLSGIESLPRSLVGHAVVLNNWDDWHDLNLQFSVVLCGVNPSETEARALSRALAPDGRIISILPLPSSALLEIAGERLVQLDLNLAYSGIVARHLATERAFGMRDWEEQ